MNLEQLLTKWVGREGGAERANYQMFLTELTQALDLPSPDPKGMGLGDYQFEAPVRSIAALGRKGTGRIDLYRRDHFILEAKQSRMTGDEPPELELPESPPKPIYDLFGHITGYEAPASRKLGRYDTLMADARIQAERYALALPAEHRSPPFLIVADIGRSFELYFDWAGNGRGYGPFPDERSYRVPFEALESDNKIGPLKLTAAAVLRAIWTDPASIDPRLRAAEVTRDIAQRLKRVAEQLEKDERERHPGAVEIAMGIEQTSLFLMRMLFCMFAEDVGLLPKDSFKTFLADAKGRSDQFWRSGLRDLWSRMNDPQEANRYWSYGDAIIRYFNGNLFSGAQVYDLPPEFKGELLVAANRDWRSVEPAIFGTLLEQVLTPKDRAKLGAHYTPRAYVERLVQATIMDVLGPEWDAVLAAARVKADAGDTAGAVEEARAFQDRLAALHILDPACGTGNFLYVAMEQLLRLEGEIRQFAAGLGSDLPPRIEPNQFLGLELNPRAAVIAELVLWIGWLRYRLANTPEAIGEPVLPPLTNINMGTHGGYDAVLARTETGEPDVANPRRPEWPEADFIVGNPPFIGGAKIRDRLGDENAEALWAANPQVPPSADFVMQWWDRAAELLTRSGTRLRRFGLVTTNSITQVFSRRVIERYLASPFPAREGQALSGARGEGETAPDASPSHPPRPSAAPPPLPEGEQNKLHLVLAIPDHPWTKVTKDAASVRIAMTVAEAGSGEGRLVTITGERALDTDNPELNEIIEVGSLSPRLRVDDYFVSPASLMSNRPFSARGIEFHADGYVLSASEYDALHREAPDFYEKYVKPYAALRDYKVGRQHRWVADLHDVTERGLREQAPALYQRLLARAYPQRKNNTVPFRRDNWWKLALPHSDLRVGLSQIERYIVTPITSRQRWFVQEDSKVLPDQSMLAIFLDDWGSLGILSSTIHQEWFIENCGWLGVGNDPRYNPTRVFDTYPFPDQSRAPIGELAEEIQQTRSRVLDDEPKLTMTNLYNLVEEVRSGAELSPQREAEVVKARARILAKLHDDLDQAVADAYGWGEEWRRAPLPPGEIVARLVRLNAQRAAEEAAGKIRWLRPGYQVPRFGKPSDAGEVDSKSP